MLNMFKSTTLMVIIVAILSTLLLVGQQFGYRWVGGDGIETQITVTSGGQEFFRGETIIADDEITKVTFAETEIFLEPKSELKIVSTSATNPEINLVQGRAIVNGPISIVVRDLNFKSSGLISFVHYSWLNSVELVSNGKEIEIMANNFQKTIKNEALKASTLPPYETEEIIFDPINSSAADFYQEVCDTWQVCFE